MAKLKCFYCGIDSEKKNSDRLFCSELCFYKNRSGNPNYPLFNLKIYENRIDKEATTCWIWFGNRSQQGYGMLKYRGHNRSAHRKIYEFFNGAVSKNLDIDHLCRNMSCVNPNHLEAVSREENIRRGNRHYKHNAKTVIYYR